MEDEFVYDPDDYDSDGFLKGSPLRCYEVVVMNPTDITSEPGSSALVGKRGVIAGFALNDGDWAYGVAIQSGECRYLFATELTSIGIILTAAEVYGPSVKQEWARINSDGECVAGDPSFIGRGPTPLYVDLERL
ncbi:MAG: hypothetical protein ACRYFS_25890 [Janthinobacterium lividum]